MELIKLEKNQVQVIPSGRPEYNLTGVLHVEYNLKSQIATAVFCNNKISKKVTKEQFEKFSLMDLIINIIAG